MKHIKIGLLPRLVLGILIGTLLGSLGKIFGIMDSVLFTNMVRCFSTFTSLFGTFLSFIIPLLIVSFVAVGLADLGKKANQLFAFTLAIAYISTVLSGFFAFFVGKFSLPFLVEKIQSSEVASVAFEPFLTITVEPIFGVMTALLLAFILGLGIANQEGTVLLSCIRELQEIVKKILDNIIIPLIPVHIAGLFCNIAAKGELIATVKMFLKLYIIILVLQWCYIAFQFAVSSFVTRENQFKKLRNIVPAYFTALGTQSSASAIPVSLECAKNNKISADIADFVIPLGATIHLAGDTICLVVGSMGILIANGVTPTLSMFVPFIFMLGVTMVAAPGIPGGGVMAALGLITSLLGFTVPMQQLIISLHFSQDSFGTACNVTGDQMIAVLVDRIDERIKK